MTEVDKQRFFICGSALRGQPDHGNLGDAEFIREAKTIPNYRLHAVGEDWHPGIYPVNDGGISVPGEVYELTQAQFDHLLATEPENLYLGTVVLEDAELVQAMLYPQELVEQFQWPDVSSFGGWAAYKASKQDPA